MFLRSHPQYDRLKKFLDSHAEKYSIFWNRPGYRCVTLKYGRPEHLVSGKGSQCYGSRWMAPGVTPVVYASTTEGIALKEARHQFSKFGIRPDNAPESP